MTEPRAENATYEFGGDTSFSYPEFAATLSRVSGTTVGYSDLSPQAHRCALIADGLSEDDADMIADSDQTIPRGELETKSHDLSRLLQRPTKTLVQYLCERIEPAVLPRRFTVPG